MRTGQLRSRGTASAHIHATQLDALVRRHGRGFRRSDAGADPDFLVGSSGAG
jgi:hypothetical protein